MKQCFLFRLFGAALGLTLLLAARTWAFAEARGDAKTRRDIRVLDVRWARLRPLPESAAMNEKIALKLGASTRAAPQVEK